MERPSDTCEPLTRTAGARAAADAPKVLVAMSGGVDSSMAASLLAERGFEVVGSMLRFWPDEREGGAFDLCCSPQAAFDARRVADRLDVPFYLWDAREAFERVVVDPFVPTYESGETPNPCVWCNREIKFGAFARRAQALGCEFMATGHYVRRVDGDGGVELHRGDDDGKDQTYFLWALPREVLPYLLFPLGDLDKDTVRAMAEERRFDTAHKKSSSGLCFVQGSVREHLRAESGVRKGPVVDVATGETVGEHDGVQFYTVGQKRGLGLFKSHRERFVVDLDAESNRLLVGPRQACEWDVLEAHWANFLCDEADLPERVMAQVRYRQPPVPARLRRTESGFALTFDAPQFAVTVGQSAVLYDGDRLLGGGVIRGRGRSDATDA